MMPTPVPEDFHTITPQIVVKGVADAIAWYAKAFGAHAFTLHLYVRDVDALFNRAVDAGADALMPVADQFWGERYGILADPSGHRWSIASRIEDLSPKALQDRARAWVKEQQSS